MRSFTGYATASLLLAGTVLTVAAPAWADDDAFFNHAKGTMSGAQSAAEPQATANGRSATSRQGYLKVEPRDAAVGAGVAENADSNNVYFNHAKGTMTGDSGANYNPTADQNGSYTASYHQYLQVEPRDAKADPNADGNVDSSNPYFNHAKGTMSGN